MVEYTQEAIIELNILKRKTKTIIDELLSHEPFSTDIELRKYTDKIYNLLAAPITTKNLAKLIKAESKIEKFVAKKYITSDG